MSKKYQVFISSTYVDLVEERKAVEETIIRAGDIPVGMEAFPAADDEQFEFIKTIIDQCDYYVLIIAGRYGSLAADGLSYTEKEYHYAVEQGVPVLVMLHGSRETLPQEHCERDLEGRELLEAFVSTVSTGRIRKEWTTTDGLKLAVREALDHAKATKARPGWVRGGETASVEALSKLVELQDENAMLKEQIEKKSESFQLPEGVADLETSFVLNGSYTIPARAPYTMGRDNQTAGLQTSYGEVFELIAPHLLTQKLDVEVNRIMFGSLWAKHHGEGGDERDFSTEDHIFQTLKVQFAALGLVSVEGTETSKGRPVLTWELTEAGKREMFSRRVVRVES